MALQLVTGIGTRQTITPQLANSIRMLQLDTPSLRAELEQALEQNLMLEREDMLEEESDEDQALDMDAVMSPGEPDDPREWEEHLTDVRADYIPSHEPEYAAPTPSLQMQLLAALGNEALAEDVRSAAIALLGEVESSGRLSRTLEELAPEFGMSMELLKAGLSALREQAPAGYAAQSVEECLHLQLRAQASTPERDDALMILHAGLLTTGHFGLEGLRRRLGFDETRFATALQCLRILDTRPGAETEDATPITPDLIVLKRGGRWSIELHSAARPRIGINRQYVRLVSAARGGASELRGQLQEARALLRGVEMRNDTLLRTGRAILRHQFAFLTGGDSAIKPLKLREIAAAIDMHESTVSRVTAGKYIQTPRGLFELRHFFSVTLRGSDDASAASAKARIRALISAEAPDAPLSDTDLMRALVASDIRIVRRTVAKYRNQMGIPTAALRRLTTTTHTARSA